MRKCYRLRFKLSVRGDPINGVPHVMEIIDNYNRRTTRLVEKWFSNAGVEPIYIKYIKSVHVAAWDEGRTVLSSGSSPLLESRVGTSHIWWEGIKTAKHSRRVHSIQYTRTGPRCFWEDPLVSAYGFD